MLRRVLSAGCILPLLVAVAGLSGCTEDNFSQIARIDLPEHETAPTLNLHVVVGDTVLTPFVGLSYGINESEPASRPARVSLGQNGSTVFDEEVPTGVDTRFVLEDSITGATLDYVLRAEVEGFDPVEARQRMPRPPAVSDLEFEIDGATDFEGFQLDAYELTLTDPAGEDNYYLFRVLSAFSPCGSAAADTCAFPIVVQQEFTTFGESPDPLLTNTLDFGFLLRDDTFDGDTYRVRFNAENFNSFAALDVYSLTEDAYLYFLSRDAYDRSVDNPFAEPANVHENVDGGHGIFMVSNRRRFIFSRQR